VHSFSALLDRVRIQNLQVSQTDAIALPFIRHNWPRVDDANRLKLMQLHRRGLATVGWHLRCNVVVSWPRLDSCRRRQPPQTDAIALPSTMQWHCRFLAMVGYGWHRRRCDHIEFSRPSNTATDGLSANCLKHAVNGLHDAIGDGKRGKRCCWVGCWYWFYWLWRW
jgi:hypothetical protein